MLPRYPKSDFYGEKERFEIALQIAPIILKELYASNKTLEEINITLPIEVARLSKLIKGELNK